MKNDCKASWNGLTGKQRFLESQKGGIFRGMKFGRRKAQRKTVCERISEESEEKRKPWKQNYDAKGGGEVLTSCR